MKWIVPWTARNLFLFILTKLCLFFFTVRFCPSSASRVTEIWARCSKQAPFCRWPSSPPFCDQFRGVRTKRREMIQGGEDYFNFFLRFQVLFLKKKLTIWGGLGEDCSLFSDTPTATSDPQDTRAHCPIARVRLFFCGFGHGDEEMLHWNSEGRRR